MPEFSTPPTTSRSRVAVRVSSDALRHIRSGHPWVYDGAVENEPVGDPGDLAVVFDSKRRFVAIGLWDPNSPICLKVLHEGEPRTIDHAFWVDRFEEAHAIRQPLRDRKDTTGYRVINGENDRLPGLIVDRYDSTLVVKLYTEAWFPHLDAVLAALQEVEESKRIVLRLARAISESHPDYRDGQTLFGTPPTKPVLFHEHGLLFEADVINGQKTGHFLDQRDNRAAVRNLAHGKRVLDVFASTGGFSVHAAAGGAPEIVSVDISEPTLKVAERNMKHNAVITKRTKHRSIVADAFAAMTDLDRAGEKFDLVVVDPPSFAQRQTSINAAMRSYRNLGALASRLVNRGGALVMCSCSSRIDLDMFREEITEGIAQGGRRAEEFAVTGHALDHPIRFREGAYLKALYFSVR